jgi:Na+/glutamate symporter
MDFFEEISKQKKDFPKLHTFTKEVKNYELNFYQAFAIGMFVVCFFLGIVFGNLFATCETTSYFYDDACLVTEFNFSLMIVIWFVSLLVSLVIFAIGHIIALLTSIDKKLH